MGMIRIQTLVCAILLLGSSCLAFASESIFSDHANNDLPGVEGLVADDPQGGALRVYFDCYLNTNVNCQDLAKSFFTAEPFAVRSNGKLADVTIEVRAWSLPNGMEQYELTFNGAGKLPSFKLHDEEFQLRSSFSAQSKIQSLTEYLIFGMGPFRKIVSYKSDPSGAFVVTYKMRGNGVPPTKKNETPVFVSVGGEGNVRSQGNFDISASSWGQIGYDTRKWLMMADAGFNYRYVSGQTAQGKSSATAFSVGGSMLVAHSVAEHWSVMVLAREGHNTLSNFDARTQLHAGIEYELIPFLDKNDNAFTVSYIVGGNHENYVTPTIDDRLERYMATHAFSVYYVRHITDVLDVTAAVAATSLVDQPKRFAVGAQATLKFYVTNALTFNLSGNVGYKNNVLNAPKEQDTNNPAFIFIGGMSAVEPVTYQLNMGFTYTWGANLIRQKDTRWQFMPGNLPVNF